MTLNNCMRFKNWLEDYGAEKDTQIRELWNEVFKALMLGGAKPDEVQRTLQDITGGSERQESAATTVVNRLKGVMPKFAQIDPDLGQRVDQAMSWLGQENEPSGDGPHPPQKTVEDLLKLMFGEERFHQLLNSDDHASDSASLTKMEPAQQNPVGPGDMNAAPTPPDPAAVPMTGAMPNQQPQVPPSPQMMQPSNPQNPVMQMAWAKWKGKRLQETS